MTQFLLFCFIVELIWCPRINYGYTIGQQKYVFLWYNRYWFRIKARTFFKLF